MELSKDLFDNIIEREGDVLEKVKGDAGGWTRAGITYDFYQGNCKRVLGVTPSRAHFERLTKDELYQFYNERFWKGSMAHLITDIKIAEYFMDCRITSDYGLRVQQRMLNAEYNANIADDNIIGPATIAAVNNAIASKGAELLLCKMKLARIDYFNELAFKDLNKYPKEKAILSTFEADIKFLIGWVRRALIK